MALKTFALAFIPIFVAVDAIGVLPIFISLTGKIKKKEKFRVVLTSVVTAICLAVGFLFLGKAVFRILGITVGDFMIAGGFVLFYIAIIDILNPGKRRRIPTNELGVVPLGTPLIVGPAVLTTSLVLLEEYGLYYTLLSVLTNVFLAGLIFYCSGILIKILGESGSKALSKILSLLLAAIAVMMIRKGFLQILPLFVK
jgi:multiple antibiotic resistance protein